MPFQHIQPYRTSSMKTQSNQSSSPGTRYHAKFANPIVNDLSKGNPKGYNLALMGPGQQAFKMYVLSITPVQKNGECAKPLAC